MSIRSGGIFRIKLVNPSETASNFPAMSRSLIQILATCFILTSCAATNSRTKPLPANQPEVDSADSGQAVSKSVLGRAVLELPPAAVADIPRVQRTIFLAHLRADKNKGRLDVKNGFREFYSDGEVPFLASSMLYMKVFPRKDGGSIVFCHMPKPQADCLPPRPGQTFFFMKRDGQWVDVTQETLPKGVDSLWLFKHRRLSSVLQTGPYKVWKKPDGTDASNGEGLRLKDLVWDGTTFHARTAKTPKFESDD